MSEYESQQAHAERQLTAAQQVRRFAAAALATVLPVSYPADHEHNVVWQEPAVETEITPPRTEIRELPLSKTEVRDENDQEIVPSEIINYLRFSLTESDEADGLSSGLIEVVKPDSVVSVDEERGELVIRTGDFARHTDLKPTDKQAQKIEVGIDGKLVYGSRTTTQEVTIPGEVKIVETTEEQRLVVSTFAYPPAVLPEKAEIKEEEKPPKKRIPKSDSPDEPEDTTEPAADEETEVVVTPPLQPEKPETQITPPQAPEDDTQLTVPEDEPELPEELFGTGGGGTGSQRKSSRIRRIKAKKGYPREASVRGAGVRRDSALTSQKRQKMSREYGRPSMRAPRLRGCLTPLVTIALLAGGAYAWRQAEFESIEDCELGTPEQPFNIVKESGEWLPEISRPDCPEPKGHEIRLAFTGFEHGYGAGRLTETGQIIDVTSIPASAVPQALINDLAAQQFSAEIRRIIRQVDDVREQIANQSGAEHDNINFGDNL